MNKMRNQFGLMAALLLGLAANAEETQTSQQSQRAQNTGASSDIGQSKQEFLRGALASNQHEIKVGKLAQERASHPAVRQLGQTLVEDHQKIQQKLQTIAKSQNVTSGESLDRDDRNRWQSLQNATGTQFDQQFLQLLIQERQNDLQRLPQMRAQFGSDPEIRKLIDENAPMLTRHRQMAEAAFQQVRANTNDPARTAGAGTTANRNPAERAERIAEKNEEEAQRLNDGTIAGVVPAPNRTVRAGSTESYIAAELEDGKVNPNVDSVLDANTRTTTVGGAPASAERNQGTATSATSTQSSNQQVPQAARQALVQRGWDASQARVRQTTVFETQVNGRTLYVTQDGKVLENSAQTSRQNR